MSGAGKRCSCENVRQIDFLFVVNFQAQRALHFSQVSDQALLCQFCIPGLDCLDDIAVMMMLAGRGVRAIIQCNHETGLRCQIVHHANQYGISSQFRQKNVKLSGQTDDGHAVVFTACLCFSGDMALEFADVTALGVFAQHGHDRWLNKVTCEKHLAGLFYRRAGNECASVRYQLDQFFVGQSREHRPNFGSADARQSNQSLLHKPGTRRQAMLQNRLSNSLIALLTGQQSFGSQCLGCRSHLTLFRSASSCDGLCFPWLAQASLTLSAIKNHLQFCRASYTKTRQIAQILLSPFQQALFSPLNAETV